MSFLVIKYLTSLISLSEMCDDTKWIASLFVGCRNAHWVSLCHSFSFLFASFCFYIRFVDVMIPDSGRDPNFD